MVLDMFNTESEQYICCQKLCVATNKEVSYCQSEHQIIMNHEQVKISNSLKIGLSQNLNYSWIAFFIKTHFYMSQQEKQRYKGNEW